MIKLDLNDILETNGKEYCKEKRQVFKLATVFVIKYKKSCENVAGVFIAKGTEMPELANIFMK